MQEMTPLLLSAEQGAQELGVGRTQMFELIKSGAVESVKIGRSRRIPRAALLEFVERLRSRAAAAEGPLVQASQVVDGAETGTPGRDAAGQGATAVGRE
jgi:excisionase family DNA binding protein